jgi:hypothetical protein
MLRRELDRWLTRVWYAVGRYLSRGLNTAQLKD